MAGSAKTLIAAASTWSEFPHRTFVSCPAESVENMNDNPIYIKKQENFFYIFTNYYRQRL